MPNLDFTADLAARVDLAHAMRKLGVFCATFEDDARRVGAAHGYRFAVDEPALARAFFDWIDMIEHQNGSRPAGRADFALFCGGLALAELVRAGPARARRTTLAEQVAAQREPARAAVADFWPEGFLYVDFCIGVVSAVIEQDTGAVPALDPSLDDLRTWWSFRENAVENPAVAAAFLDRFFGRSPNWAFPDHLSVRPGSAGRAVAKG